MLGTTGILELSSINGSNGYVINGISQSGRMGQAASSAGDVNGDGLADFILGTEDAEPVGNDSGQAYVVFGSSSGLTSLDLSSLNGTNGFLFNGAEAYDRGGYSVSGVGDVNGDGFDDVIVGAPSADVSGQFTREGQAYLIFGSSAGFDMSLTRSDLDGSNGVVLTGTRESDFLGRAVSAAGDMNDDGIDDFAIFGSAAYVVFGSTAGFSASVDLTALDGTNGFTVTGIGGLTSRALASAGDVNGDGISDLMVAGAGANTPYANYAGETAVIFGSSAGFPAEVRDFEIDGSNGFIASGANSLDYSGRHVDGVGDVNGDGIDDVAIGVRQGDPNGLDGAGNTYIIFGTTDGFDAGIALQNFDGYSGFVINGAEEGDFAGRVSGAGDVNGDGVADIIIGAAGAEPDGIFVAGKSYVLFGTTEGFGAAVELSAIDGTNGFVIQGSASGGFSGTVTEALGDTNGDGIDDILVTAPGEDIDEVSGVGRAYVIYGYREEVTGTAGNDTITGTFGFERFFGLGGNDQLDGGDGVNFLDGGAGDDLFIGGIGADTFAGGSGSDTVSYLASGAGISITLGSTATATGGDAENDTLTDIENITGTSFDDVLDGGDGTDNLFAGGAGNDTIIGGSGRDTLIGGLGNDTITGGSQDDSISGGEGDDNLTGNGGRDSINGGEGNDTLSGGGGRDTLEGRRGADVIIGGDSADTIEGGEGDDMIDGRRGSDTIFGNEGNDIIKGNGLQDTIFGNDGDDIIFGGGGNDFIVGDNEFGNFVLGNDTIIGGAGNDNLQGVVGDDTIFGGSGNDLIDGGTGNDILNGGGGNDTITGGADGDDTISGGAGDDEILGRSGDDIIFGGGGDDFIDGGPGNDTVTGNGGADTFCFLGGDQFLTITDFEDDIDTLDMTFNGVSLINPGDITLEEVDGNVLVTSPVGVVTILNFTIAQLQDDFVF